jgi:hypothetical protein
VLLVVFDLFAVLRALPQNSALEENRLAERGTYHRNVYRVFRLAQRQAAPPFFDVKNHALYFDRNPGLFMFVAELFVRAGASTPLPNQLLSIALWNGGFVMLYLWLLALFRNERAAAAAVAFLAFTPFALFYSSSIHHEPWCFFFFNLTFYCYVSYLRANEGRMLASAWVAYFLLCQSYWFYYMSAGLLLIALQWHERKLSLRDTLLLALAPVGAALTTFLQVVYALGGFEAALFRMLDIAAARTLDVRIEGSQWYPHKQFLQPHHLRSYPQIVRERIETLSGMPLLAFVTMLAASCIVAGRRLGFMLPVLLAGLSWSLVMIQHTVIHRFAGMYSWFAWTLIVAVFVHELEGFVRPQWRGPIVLALALLLVAPSVATDYAPYLRRYTIAAYTGRPQPRSFVRPQTNKKDPLPLAADPLDRAEEED